MWNWGNFMLAIAKFLYRSKNFIYRLNEKKLSIFPAMLDNRYEIVQETNGKLRYISLYVSGMWTRKKTEMINLRL